MPLLLVPYIHPPSNLLLFLLLFRPDARGECKSLPMHRGIFSAQTRTGKKSCGWRMTSTDVPRKMTVTTRAIFPPPHKAQMVSEGESQGRHLDTGSGLTRKHDRRARTANSLASWTRKDCPTPCACAITFSPHRRQCPLWTLLKKNWSPSCPLNGSFQLPNCPLKGFFSLAKRDFLVANGRMAADFSSPAALQWYLNWCRATSDNKMAEITKSCQLWCLAPYWKFS